MDRLLAHVDGVTPLPAAQHALYLAAFTACFAPLLYLGPSALARRWLKPDLRTVLLYAGTAYFFGGGLELVMNRVFLSVLGRPCYVYDIWPLHGGDTSGTGVVIWPLYGWFVCLLHQALPSSFEGAGRRAVLLAVDAMVLEVVANLFSLHFFGSWLFWYVGTDLGHFTSLEAFPIYVLGGFPGLLLLARLERHPHRAWLGAALWLLMLLAVFQVPQRLLHLPGPGPE